MDLNPDTLLNNRYQIQSKLGQGGMGAVYLAVDLALDAQVAVKLNRNPAYESTAQFLREARLLASLRHPNLPRVTDYFILDDAQYLVMDYIAGKDLDTLLKEQGPQPLTLVMDWARQLGYALSYLHQQQPPVVHRDVKPANVRLSLEGEAILVDFGIAKAVDTSQATATGASGYTPGYAPPEQYGGNMHTGPHTDQYSFAALLFHMLTAQKPADSVQRALGQSSLASLAIMRPDVPHHVQAALEKALSLKTNERFDSMDDLLRALNMALPGTPSVLQVTSTPHAGTSGPTIIPTQASSPIAGRSPAAGDTPTASYPTTPSNTTAAGSSTAADAHSNPSAPTLVGARPEIQPGPAGGSSPQSEGTPAISPPVGGQALPARRQLNWLLVGGLSLLAALALGAVIVLSDGLAGRTPQGANQGLPVSAQQTETPQPGSATVVQAAAATITPQPSQAATGTLTPTLPPSASTTVTKTETPLPSETLPPSATSMPLGRGGLVVFASDRADGQTLQLWSMRLRLADSGLVTASDLTQLTTSPGDKRSPVWSPDGTRLLYVAPGGEGMGLDIWVINADGSGEALNLTQRKGDDTEPAWSPDGSWIAFTNNGREDRVRMLYLIRPDGTGLKRLSTEQEEFGATWSPDMQLLGSVMKIGDMQVLYLRDEQDKTAVTPVHQYFVTPQRFDRLELLGNLGQVSDPAWSPDGTWVSYTRLEGNKRRVYLARYPVKQPAQDIVRLTDGTKDEQPSWSPDGQWILFNSENAGNPEIYIMRATGQLQTNLTGSPGRDFDAAWQPLP